MRVSICLVILALSVLAAAQTWCGKHYMKSSPIVSPGGQFQLPDESTEPLLNFQCWPAIKPYLSGETASLIIDTRITSLKVPGATTIKNSEKASSFDLSISINGVHHPLGSVPLNTTGAEFSLPANLLKPRKKPFEVTCTGVLLPSKETFTTSTEIQYLPAPSRGSVTKQDFRTGALLVQNRDTKQWEPVFPLGFYTSFDGYLSNVANVDAIKARGMNIVHPVPTFDNHTALVEALDRMEELGLWLMYDMRFTYQNLTSVKEQVEFIKDRKNLLLWYTGDEPDGTSDPLNATKITYDLINELDGYHPVSLVLYCQDYFFADYSLGADVLMQDTYPVGINATFSTVWGTPCTRDYGDCGCDNCKGSLWDISDRMDEFKVWLDLLGRSRSTAVWTVPQAFGPESYWPHIPTGDEWLVESILGINHGALGVVPWDDPTSADIRRTSSALAAALPHIVPFLASPKANVVRQKTQSDIAMWKLEDKTLLLAANPSTKSVSTPISGVSGHTPTQILDGGGKLTMANGEFVLTLQGTGTAGFVFRK